MITNNNQNLFQSAEDTRARLKKRPGAGVIPLKKEIGVSFEFFPPASDTAAKSFSKTIDQLAPLNPDFVSVTYGAGGTEQDRTINTVKSLGNIDGFKTAAHLTCVGASRERTDKVINTFVENGIEHIVALRGDSPDIGRGFRPHSEGYQNAADLVSGIRKQTNYSDNIEISVAAYPEVHPDSPSAKHDLDNLKRKLDQGANRAITQYFFDADTFLRFRDAAYDAGVTAPIIPGILPVTNFARVVEFSKRCGTTVPEWMKELFSGLDDAPELRQMVATTVTAELCTRLIDNGVNVFHFYTLNRPELTQAICHILGIRAQQSAPRQIQAIEV